MTHLTFQPSKRHWAYQFIAGSANLFSRFGLKPKQLRADKLMSKARNITGLSDFGSDFIEHPLQQLLTALTLHPNLESLARYTISSDILHTLCARLKIIDHINKHPKINDIPIRKPLFIIGLPRTGTTLLYNLLACAPGARVLRNYEERFPLPDPNQIMDQPDLRIKQSQQMDHFYDLFSKESKVIHEAKAEQVGEGFGLLKQSFMYWGYLEAFQLPEYENWLWQSDAKTLAKTYDYFQLCLKILMQQQPKDYWVLKSPYHLNNMAAIAVTHPDVNFVMIHRDLKSQMASQCSQIGVGRNFLLRNRPASFSQDIGQEVFTFTLRSLQRLLEFRAHWPDDQVIDVNYSDLVKNPIDTRDTSPSKSKIIE